MCAPSPPPPPNYAAAATAQGVANVDTAIANTILNRPTEITPYGTRGWEQTGTYTIPKNGTVPAKDIPLFTSTINMTPLGQQTFDQQQRISSQLGGMAESGLGRIEDSFSTPYGMDGVKGLTDRAETAIMDRLNPQLEKYRAQTESNLIARGHNPQNESYGAQMNQVGQQENDARTQAILKALQYSPQLMQQELAMRNQPLNEMNALRTGAQVNLPQFNAPPATNIAPPPIFGAAQAQGQADIGMYNAQAAGAGGLQSGLFGLGAAALMSPTGTFNFLK